MAGKGTITGKELFSDDAITRLNTVNEQIKSILSNYEGLIKSAQKFTTPTQGNAIKKGQSEEGERFNIMMKERVGILKKIAVQEERNKVLGRSAAENLAKQRYEASKLNKINKDSAIQTSKYADAYDKLANRTAKAKRNLKNLTITEGELSKKTRKARIEFEKLNKRLRQADNLAGDFQRNVGNYPNSFSKATTALRGLVGAFGLYSGLQIAKQIYSQVKELDGLNKSLKQVTQSQDLFNASQLFLKETAEESGANILSLTKAYTKFLASAKTTNLTGEQTNNIFRQVSKAAGVLGLSTDDANGAFRALEQILSKGKVQAEEIRGQLGERLPGAFQILAKSMGLTTAELSKQLELGNVLSEEVLPGFADELERVYSLDKVERVETLAAEQERLGNAWISFVKSVEDGEGKITRVLGGMMTFVTNSVKGFEYLFKSVEQVNNEFSDKTRASAYKSELEVMQGAAADLGETIKQVAARNFFDYTKAVEQSRGKIAELRAEQEKSPTARVKKEIESEVNLLAIKEGRLDAVNSVLRKNTDDSKDNSEEIKKTSKAVSDLTPRLKKLKAAFTDLTDSETAEQLAKRFRTIFEDENIVFGVDAIEAPSTEEMEKVLLDKIPKIAKQSAANLEEIFSNVFDTFEGFYGIDLAAFKNLMSGKETSAQDYANFAKSVSGAILDSQLIRYDNQIVANQERLDTILNDDNASEEKKKQAQIEADKVEKKLRIKQAKAERKNVLVQIAIDTAAGIAKALAQTGVLAPAVIPTILGLGLAQAAFVASQPLPKHFKGTENARKGLAWTDEQGAEIHTDKRGNVKDWGSSGGARLKMLESGDKIFTAPKSKEIMNRLIESEDVNIGNVSKQLNLDAKERVKLLQIQQTSIDTKDMEQMMERVMMKYANRPLKANVNAIINQPTTGFRV